MSRNLKMIPITCAQCGAQLNVDSSTETTVCPYCGTSFIVGKDKPSEEQEASGSKDTVKSVLGFLGEQMSESRKFKAENRKYDAEIKKLEMEEERQRTITMLKVFPVLMAVCFAMLIISQRFGLFNDEDSGESVNTLSTQEGTLLTYYVGEDGLFWIDVEDKEGLDWAVENYYTTMELKDAIADDTGCHFSFSPDDFEEDGTQYAVLGQYDAQNDGDTVLYAVGEAEISEGEIVDTNLEFTVDPEEIGS